MKIFTTALAAFVAAITLGSATMASAAQFLWTYIDTVDGHAAGSGLFTTSDVANPDGSFQLLSFTGFFDGYQISGLEPNPTPGIVSLSSDANYLFDNNIRPFDAVPFSLAGALVHMLAGPYLDVNFYGAGDGFTTVDRGGGSVATPGIPGASYSQDISRGNFTAYALPGVPEPATWAMMIMGFGLIGASLRRRVYA